MGRSREGGATAWWRGRNLKRPSACRLSLRAEFAGIVPAAFQLENVLTVGAVDQAGEVAPFTSVGDAVDVFASGFAAESVVPGGRKLAFAGTSVACPHVTNLVVKMLGIEPGLTPPEVVKAIVKSADPAADSSGSRLLHPARALNRLARS